jgi:uncharacterized protein YjgD (DUF1641 family)
MTSTMLSHDDRLDLIAARLDGIADELAAQRAERAKWSELVGDLTPLASRGLEVGARYLDESEVRIGDVGELGSALLEAMPALTMLVSRLGPLAELAGMAAPLLEPAFQATTARLADLDERGYFDFAAGGLGVVDQVVTSFDRSDLEALGDNIVLILQTVRDMTQPEVMTMLRRTFSTVTEEDPAGPPGTLALLRELRDPGVRRGLAKVLHTLRTLGEEPADDPTDQRR